MASFYKAAPLLFQETHPWTAQLNSTYQEGARLIQKPPFQSSRHTLDYLRYSQSSRARFAKIQEDLDRQTSIFTFSMFSPLDPKFLLQCFWKLFNLPPLNDKLDVAPVAQRPNISEMMKLKHREPGDSSNLSMVKIYLAQDWIVPWALTFFGLDAAIVGFNHTGVPS